MPPWWWDYIMSRVIALVACGFTVAACSASMPSLNFLSSSPPSEALRFESEPPGAEVKTSGQTCRTPCELTVQVAPEMSATFALNGYQPQTISVRSEASAGLAGPRLAPNPVHVELRPVPVAPPAKKRVKKKTPVAAAHANLAVASAAPTAPAQMSAAMPASSPAPEAAASATNYPWPAGRR
jgi:hypothetical protein